MTYLHTVLDHWFVSGEENIRRLVALFGLLMTTIQFLSIRFALNPRFDVILRPGFGLKCMAVAIVLSSLLHFWFFGFYDIEELPNKWTPPKKLGF